MARQKLMRLSTTTTSKQNPRNILGGLTPTPTVFNTNLGADQFRVEVSFLMPSPLQNPPAVKYQPNATMNSPEKKILIAEDNPALLAVVKFNLERAGYDAHTSTNGTEAFELAMMHKFDLIITDHQMPGLSGVELCSQLRTHPEYATTNMMMLTAKSLELDRDHILNDLGVKHIFSKPFSPTEIIKAVDELFNPAAVQH